MRGARSILVLAAVTALVIGAVIFAGREPTAVARSGEVVFPKLLEQVNSVARVRVTRNDGTFTLARDGERWVVEEKDGYAADPDRMHKLLLGAAGMTRVEPKTSNPELYPKLRLDEPTKEDSKAARFVLENSSGVELANWVLGDRRPSKSDPGRSELYIRVAGDPQAWLVEASVPGGRAIIDWIDRLVARIDRNRLRAVVVVHADGETVGVAMSATTEADFALDGIPEGREVDSQYRINDIGRILEDLRFEDVDRSSSLDFAGSVDKRVQVTTFDGLRIRIETVMRDGEAWAALHAEVDETLADGREEDVDAEPEAAGALRSIEDVRAEAGELNARWTGWAYELPSYKRDYLARRIEELTKPVEEPDEGKEESNS